MSREPSVTKEGNHHVLGFCFDNIAILSITNIDGALGNHDKLSYIFMHVAFVIVLPSLRYPKTSAKSTSFSVIHMIVSGLRCLKLYAALLVLLNYILLIVR